MIDETLIYKLVNKVSPENLQIEWFANWPASFNQMSNGLTIGCWKIADSTNAYNTSTRREHSTRLRIELQTWSETPEERMKSDNAIDAIFGELFYRQGLAHPVEQLPDKRMAYRSIFIYTGVVDNKTLHVRRT